MKREFVTAPKEHQGGDEGVETHTRKWHGQLGGEMGGQVSWARILYCSLLEKKHARQVKQV